jgi:HTH-type transcriptional regulator, sugar sensing transcriptional regulator
MGTQQEKTSSLEESLKQIGFSEPEAAIYLALLELGRGTVSQIASRAKIQRTSGYHILSALTAKGLATISGREPKQEYVAESPTNLERYAQRELERQKGIAARTTSLISDLTAISSKGDRPRVRFFEGVKGLKDVYEDTLTATEPIRAMANVDDMHKALPNYFPTYYERRTRKGIAIRAIIPSTGAGKDRAKKDKEENRETALVPPKEFSFSPEINIYDNKVMIASWREKLGIIIESAEIADAMKKTFELAWAEAKRLDEKSRPT